MADQTRSGETCGGGPALSLSAVLPVAPPPTTTILNFGSITAIKKHNLNRKSETIDMAIGTAMFNEEKKYFSEPFGRVMFSSGSNLKR